MSADDLHRPLYVADLLANALNRGTDRPLLHLLALTVAFGLIGRLALRRFA